MEGRLERQIAPTPEAGHPRYREYYCLAATKLIK